jgi:hypothetical protein
VDIIPWVIHGPIHIQERNLSKKGKGKGRRINEKQNEHDYTHTSMQNIKY